MSATLEDALGALGDLLESQSQTFELVAIGGGSLLLLKLIDRPTKDLDILARIQEGSLVTAEPLPDQVKTAVQDVGAALNLGPEWLNAGPTSQLETGLPEGFASRMQAKRYGERFTLHIAGRFDQVCLKLFATVDQGPSSKHFADLKLLRPTADELAIAGAWVQTQDASQEFAAGLKNALTALQEVGDR